MSDPDKMPWVKPLGTLVKGCLDPVIARYGFGQADIISCWPDIVGTRMASNTEPLRLQWNHRGAKADEASLQQPATLVMRVDSGFAIELQHLAPAVIGRINEHLGWRCVGKLALRQGPLQRHYGPKPPVPPPAPHMVERAVRATEGINDDKLRQALTRLGARVFEQPK